MCRYLLLVLFAQPVFGGFNIDFELKGAPEAISPQKIAGNNWGYGGMIFLHKIGFGGYDFRVWSTGNGVIDTSGDIDPSVERHDFGFDVGYLLVSYLPRDELKVEKVFMYPFISLTEATINVAKVDTMPKVDTNIVAKNRYTEYSAGMSLTFGVSMFRVFLEPTLNLGKSGGFTMPIGLGWEATEGSILFIKYDQLRVNGPLKSCWNSSIAFLF